MTNFDISELNSQLIACRYIYIYFNQKTRTLYIYIYIYLYIYIYQTKKLWCQTKKLKIENASINYFPKI